MNAPKARSAAEAAIDDFYTERSLLITRIETCLQARHLPAYTRMLQPDGGATGHAGWSLMTSIVRGVIVRYDTGSREQPPTAADLAPHQRALERAGLIVKTREQDGKPILLVFGPPES